MDADVKQLFDEAQKYCAYATGNLFADHQWPGFPQLTAGDKDDGLVVAESAFTIALVAAPLQRPCKGAVSAKRIDSKIGVGNFSLPPSKCPFLVATYL